LRSEDDGVCKETIKAANRVSGMHLGCPQDLPASEEIMRMPSVAKYTTTVCFRPKWIDLPACSTKVQGNRRVECAAFAFAD
jgi:hypothetical protein